MTRYPHIPGVAVALALACAGPTGPTVRSVAGTYHAVEFRITGFTGEVIDYLALGGTVNLTLRRNGESAGALEMPSESYKVLLDGSWVLADSVIKVEIDAQAYPGDLTFTIRDHELVGGGGWPDAYLTLTLIRSVGGT